MKTSVSLAVVSVCCSSVAFAQTERDLDSHLHGAANLNVAVIASEVQLELSTPWNNLVGFEHAPSTDEQHVLVDEALALLNNPDELFSFNNATCSATEVVIDNSMGAEDGHDDHDDEHAEKDDHGHDDHEDEHAEKDDHGHDEHDDDHAEKDDHGHDEHDDEHAEKEDHGHGHDDEHGESESVHSTVLALYTYQCSEVDQLDTIELSLFERWSGLVDLDVQLVGDSGQTMLELNRENSSIDISQVR